MSNTQIETIELIKTINERLRKVENRQFDLIDCTIQIYSALLKLDESIEFGSKHSLKKEIGKIKDTLASALNKAGAESNE